MKKAIPYIIIASLLLVIFMMQTCEGLKQDPVIVEIEVPEKKGSFDTEKPTHQDSSEPTLIKWKDREIKVANPVNENLLFEYKKLEDSLNAKEAEYRRLLMFVNAIQFRDYSQTFEDSLIKIDIFGKVQGEIQSMQSNYIIKSQKVTAKINQDKTVFRLLVGLEFGNNLQFNDFRYKANIGFQNAQGNIIRGGYEKLNNRDYIFVGYDFSVFEIRIEDDQN